MTSTIQQSSQPEARTAMLRKFALVALIAGAVGGCASRSGMQATSDLAETPLDYRERHPIVVGDVKHSLDVFLVPNNGIDHRQAEDLREFVKDYRARGKGGLVASLPPNAPPAAVQYTLREIRKFTGPGLLVAQGATHPTAASIRLSYAALDAKVGSRCGQWPHDPSGGSTLQSWANQPYYNLGCSQQSMMAAQAANPLDHVRPRTDGPYDIERRMNDIKSVRQGSDPGTSWKVQLGSGG